MLYCTFLFWFWYRLGLALLAHFNWAASIYFSCIYFELWKSYDLLWFWMHLILCACIPTLRSDNYLLVWFTMINKKLRICPEKSFKQIYEESYRRKRKQAKAAYELAIKEKVMHYNIDDDNVSRDSDAMECGRSADGGSAVVNLYPALKTVSEGDASVNFVSVKEESNRHRLEPLACELVNNEGNNAAMTSADGQTSRSNVATDANNSDTDKPIDILRPDFTNKYDAVVLDADTVSKQLKREKKEKKALEKRLRKEQKAELARKAKQEARRQAIADAISLLLFLLRLRVTFSILIGNIRRSFVGAQFKSSLSVVSISALSLLLRATIFIDIILFWFTCQWIYLRQCRLVCQLGICRFWAYAAILVTVGGLFMELPMYWVQHKLDDSWCEFSFD